MKKKIFIINSVLIVITITSVITFIGAFCPVYLESYEGIYNMKFGFPLKFVTQTTDLVFNANLFPRYVAPQYQNESFETDFEFDFFLISVFINLLIATAVYAAISLLYRQYRKKHPKKPKKKKDEYTPVFK